MNIVAQAKHGERLCSPRKFHGRAGRGRYARELLMRPKRRIEKVFDIDEDKSPALFFDVCGKGIKAANMVMAMGETLGRLNRLLWKLTPEEMYAAAQETSRNRLSGYPAGMPGCARKFSS